MSDLDNRFKTKCPRKLDELPQGWCSLAVLRLKSIRALDREPSELEESKLPGCPWAINNQTSGYCWFKYESKNMPDTPPADVEIAAMLNIQPDTVKSTFESAMSKLKNADFVKDIKAQFGTDRIIDDKPSQDEDFIY